MDQLVNNNLDINRSSSSCSHHLMEGPSEEHSLLMGAGDLLQTLWEGTIVPVVGENDFYHHIFGLGLVLGYAYYFGFCFIFTLIDWFNWPQFVTRHKLQPGATLTKDKKNQLNLERAFNIWKVVLFNQVFVFWPFLLFGFFIRSLRPVPAFRILPSLFTFVYSIAFTILCEDVVYYCLHRGVMHHRKVYKHVHKLHHEITAPIAAGTSYCSPFEHLVNLTTVAIGPLILQSHMAVMFVCYLYATTVSLYQHCGYEIPYIFFLFPPASTHDFHHEKPSNQMYGKYGLMDYAFGTDRLWRQNRITKKSDGRFSVANKKEEAIIKQE